MVASLPPLEPSTNVEVCSAVMIVPDALTPVKGEGMMVANTSLRASRADVETRCSAMTVHGTIGTTASRLQQSTPVAEPSAPATTASCLQQSTPVAPLEPSAPAVAVALFARSLAHESRASISDADVSIEKTVRRTNCACVRNVGRKELRHEGDTVVCVSQHPPPVQESSGTLDCSKMGYSKQS